MADNNNPAAVPAAGQQSSAEKSKNADKNEAKRLAKMEKFLAKQKAQAEKAKTAPAPKEEKKAKAEKAPVAATPEPAFVNTTPAGEKKDMSQPMAASYNPRAVESAWNDWWEKEGFFQPELTADGQVKPEGLFVVAAPPPNVTGSLHIGHALAVTIQDGLARWSRMLGKTVLFNPGTDHAGISTQAVVEKQLWKEQKKTRHDLGREVFVEEIWKWKDVYHKRISDQVKRLGASYDWSREAFTLSPSLSKAVTETFCTLHEEGVIYRATRLVNWCTALNTALSNLEVESKELSGRTLMNVPGYDAKEKFEFGVLISFAYPVEGSDEKIVVATTRIETMIGDTAVAVHPQDPRYKHLHGKFVVHPFSGRRIPIITDDIVVDMAFGTGAVKMTPAHDFNDYEVGKRHNLEFINILNDDGTLNNNCGPFTGMKRFHARVAVLNALKEKGLYIETKDNAMVVPVCSKTGDVIEPLMKPQWWVNCKDMAAAALQAAKDGDLTIRPQTSEKDYYRWMENINDWCISRQIWWGHRVPAYFVRFADDEEQDFADGQYWVSGRTLEAAEEAANKKFPGKKFTLEQDPDVLDTWFSSGLWPFSILGWPEKTADFEKFYPTTLLETGWDILFFWVARMVMLGIKMTGKVPFSEVFCHALIRDAQGRKMSKSLGNVIDPLDVIEGITLQSLHDKLRQGNLDPREITRAEAGQKADFPNGIPECGSDALRFCLGAYSAFGRDINLDINRVDGYRKFCNKLWNATRFALLKLDDGFVPKPTNAKTGHESLAERWILHKLNLAAKEVNSQMEQRNFMKATEAVYNFWLYELCDVYIEIIKPVTDGNDAVAKRSAQDTLYTCLEGALRMLHPFMPFLTEELYQRLPRRPEDKVPTICKSAYPVFRKDYDDEGAEADFELVFQVIRAGRSLMADYNLIKGAQIFVDASPEIAKLLRSEEAGIMTLIKGCQSCKVVEVAQGTKVPEGCAASTIRDGCIVHLLVKGMVDVDAEVAKIEKKLVKVTKAHQDLVKKTQEATYVTKVREDIRATNDVKIKDYEAEIETLNKSIQMFLKLKD
ncbi:AP-1 adaptor complex sigma subunit Aps1 [Actinomortierella ambigua]|uniref:Probable valine--tRNA ligase, cytoplasmic n=1 Tax=Actinomortierella ambigua TaxID=1343610 RepID=A0A9P6PWW3_9FUNG|nr:AP-1 adaptor complex sigma subunit Aps1 [Actinomortierella ambigua]